MDELWQGIRQSLRETERARLRGRRLDRAESRFLALLSDRLLERVRSEALTEESFQEIIQAIASRQIDPYSAAEKILQRLEVR